MTRLTLSSLGLAVVVALLILATCRQQVARSARSFDEIKDLVDGKTAAQVLLLLGEPDSRQVVLDANERWIWWNFTTLEGNDYPPEIRGVVVHLEVLFENPQENTQSQSISDWRVHDVFGVTFREPVTQR